LRGLNLKIATSQTTHFSFQVSLAHYYISQSVPGKYSRALSSGKNNLFLQRSHSLVLSAHYSAINSGSASTQKIK
jgi:hypothetical protein